MPSSASAVIQLSNYDPSPFAGRCRMTDSKQLPVDVIDPPEGGPRSPVYMALTPIGEVPALVLDDGSLLSKSGVILAYLADRFPDSGLLPPGAEDRARARLPCRIVAVYLMPPMQTMFRQRNPETREASVLEAAQADTHKAMGFLKRSRPR